MEIFLAKFSSIGYSAFMFILILGIVVFIHELGHFLVARYHGFRVEQFCHWHWPRTIW